MKALGSFLVALALAAGGCGGSDETPPPPPPAPPAAGAPAPGRGLTVGEALESKLDGPLQVQGFLREEDGEVRLCGAILESFPPQCGEPSLRVDGFDVKTAAGVQSAEGVRWVEHASVLGTVEDGVLTVSPTVSS